MTGFWYLSCHEIRAKRCPLCDEVTKDDELPMQTRKVRLMGLLQPVYFRDIFDYGVKVSMHAVCAIRFRAGPINRTCHVCNACGAFFRTKNVQHGVQQSPLESL